MLLGQQQTGSLMHFSLSPLFEEHGLPLAVMGIVVVYLALALVVAFISLLPRLVGWIAVANPQQPVDPWAATEDELPEEHLVLIAAAVAATTGQPHRIVRIGGVRPEDQGWSLEGRMQHHQSHRLQHRDRR